MVSVVELLRLQLRQHVRIMTEQQPGAGPLHQVPGEPIAPPPRGMVSEQPSERPGLLVIVAKVKLIAGQEERARVGKIQTQAHQSRRVSSQQVQIEPVEQLDVIPVEGLPVEREVEVVGQVGSEVLARGNGVERVFQLIRVDVDRNVGAAKELEASSVVEVEVRKHNGFDVGEAVTGGADHRVEPVFFPVVRDCEELEDGRRPELPGVGSSPGVVQDWTNLRVVDERADDCDPAPRRLRSRGGQCADAGAGQREAFVVLDVAKIERIELHLVPLPNGPLFQSAAASCSTPASCSTASTNWGSGSAPTNAPRSFTTVRGTP